jgi:hypothetical protein
MLTILCIGVNAQNVNIPDANFKAYLVGNAAINTNSDTEIQVSEANSFSGVVNVPSLNISDLTGIEAFNSIVALYCDFNNLTSLILPNNTNLATLTCINNAITSLNLTVIPNLFQAYCGNNSLTGLNTTGCTAMSFLNCSNNNLTSLDLTTNTGLTNFVATQNNLTSLNIANGNNTNIFGFNAFNTTLNPNLTCIQVDDVAWSTTNWTEIDPTTSFSTDCSLGIDEQTINNILIYPNPVESKLTIDSKENIKRVTIIDIMGKTVQSISIMNTTIDVSSLTEGIYFLQIQTDKGLVSKKFIKE